MSHNYSNFSTHRVQLKQI